MSSSTEVQIYLCAAIPTYRYTYGQTYSLADVPMHQALLMCRYTWSRTYVMLYRHGAIPTCSYSYMQVYLHGAIPTSSYPLCNDAPTHSSTCCAGTAAGLCGSAAHALCRRQRCLFEQRRQRALHGSGACPGCCRAGCQPAPRAQSPEVLWHEVRGPMGVPGCQHGCGQGARAAVPSSTAIRLGLWDMEENSCSVAGSPGARSGSTRAAAATNPSRLLKPASPMPQEPAGKALPALAQPVPQPGGTVGPQAARGWDAGGHGRGQPA